MEILGLISPITYIVSIISGCICLFFAFRALAKTPSSQETFQLSVLLLLLAIAMFVMACAVRP